MFARALCAGTPAASTEMNERTAFFKAKGGLDEAVFSLRTDI